MFFTKNLEKPGINSYSLTGTTPNEIRNILKDCAFCMENREVKDDKKFLNLVSSIQSYKRLLSTIEVIQFDPNDYECLLKGKAWLLDLNFEPLEESEAMKKKYLIIDGQHRITAILKILDDPTINEDEKHIRLKMMVDPALKRRDLFHMNGINKPWKMDSYVKGYAECGIEFYNEFWIIMQHLVEKGFGYNDIAYYYQQASDSNVLNSVRSLEYKFDKTLGNKVVGAAEAFRSTPGLEKIWNKQGFVRNLKLIIQQFPEVFDAHEFARYVNEHNIDLVFINSNEDNPYTKKAQRIFMIDTLKNIIDEEAQNRTNNRNFTLRQKQFLAGRDFSGRIPKCAHSECTVHGIGALAGDHFLKSWKDKGETLIDNG